MFHRKSAKRDYTYCSRCRLTTEHTFEGKSSPRLETCVRCGLVQVKVNSRPSGRLKSVEDRDDG